MQVLNTLYITSHRSRVSLERQTLMVTDPELGKQRVPLSTLEGIVLLGAAQVSTQVMAECVRRQIRLVSMQRNGRVRFVVGGPTRGNIHLRVAQYRKFDDPNAAAALARMFVMGKLQNCRRMLKRWSWDAEENIGWTIEGCRETIDRRLQSLPGVENGDRIRGIEGESSRQYFKGMRAALWRSGYEFSERNRRPPRDPVNALLSFTYGIVLGEVVGSLEAVGLDPQLGFLHGLRAGRPSLGLDLVEELRPAIADRFSIGLLRRRMISESHFEYRMGGACFLTDTGRKYVLQQYEKYRAIEVPHILLQRRVPRSNIATIQATLLARHLRGDIPEYPPYLMAA